MPTSGGGGHGGFGGGGSFHGGGSHGSRGGRGSSLNTFWFFAPHYYYRGGIGVFFAPVIAMIIVFALIVFLLFAAIGNAQNKQIAYSEEVADLYALEKYDDAFGGKQGYEDKILLAFFPYENHVDFDFITMIGDDLIESIHKSLRGKRSELKQAMDQYIDATDFETTLGSDLSSVVDALQVVISSYGDPYRAECEDTVHVNGKSYLQNESNLQIDKEMVDQSLTAFTEATGIEFVIVVEDAAEVFGYESSETYLFFILFLAILEGAIIFAVVRGVKARKKHQNESQKGNSGYTTGAEMDGTAKKPDSDNDFNQGDNW